MTKQQIITEISKRLNDPNAGAFADRIWGYFIETLYEAVPNLTPAETINQTKTHTGFVTTDVQGIATPTPNTQPDWNAIYSVKVGGVPARQIDQEEYTMMLTNAFYMPTGAEAAFYFDGKQLVIITGRYDTHLQYSVSYLADAHTDLSGITSSKDIGIPNALVYKALPLVVAKIRAEIGLMI